jgi:AcrR family transcriptional regulator
MVFGSMTPTDTLDRERWEAAALDAFERGGLAAVAVEPLARALGVTKGSFYWHFKNRPALIAATVARWERLHVDAPLDALAHVEDPRRRLLGLLTAASDKPPTIFMRILEAVDEPVVRAAVTRAAELRVAFLEQGFRDLGLTPARARRQALLAYSTYVGRAHLGRDAPELLGDQKALARHLAEQLIPASPK